MRGVFLMALIESCSATIGRRGVILGVTSSVISIQLAAPPALANPDSLDSIRDRAKSGSLTTDRVIYRAMNDDLVNPRDINDCEALEKIYKIDLKAADEMRATNEMFMKMNAAASFTDVSPRNLGGYYASSLKDSYEIGRLVEQRIRERASKINFQRSRDCIDR